jgi:hypothetical protein
MAVVRFSRRGVGWMVERARRRRTPNWALASRVSRGIFHAPISWSRARRAVKLVEEVGELELGEAGEELAVEEVAQGGVVAHEAEADYFLEPKRVGVGSGGKKRIGGLQEEGEPGEVGHAGGIFLTTNGH